jgi:hypothetical protein
LQLARLKKKKDNPEMADFKAKAISNMQRLKERRKLLMTKTEVVSLIW